MAKTSKTRTKWIDGECVTWVAGPKARRVPLFVIATTGLKTKKAIVKKYGLGAAFVKTKPGKAKLIQKGQLRLVHVA